MTERQATEEELDSILVDVWSYRSNDKGQMERTGMETITLREAVRRGASGMVTLRTKRLEASRERS